MSQKQVYSPRNHQVRSSLKIVSVRRRTWTRALASVLFLAGFAQAQTKTARVGVVVDGPSDFYEQIGERFKKEALALTEDEVQIQVDKDRVILCDFTKTCVSDALDKLLADKELDLVIGQGFIASNELLERKKLNKPALAPFVIDPRAQGIDPENVPKNLSYILWSSDIGSDLRTFSQVVNFKKVALLVSKKGWSAMPQALSTHLIDAAKQTGKELVVIEIDANSQAALQSISDQIDAAYVGPLFSMSPAERMKLASGLAARKLPSFSWMGEVGVQEGFLCGSTAVEDANRLARRFALNVQSLLLGETPDSLRTKNTATQRLFLNGPLAKQLGVSPNIQNLLNTTIVGAGFGNSPPSINRASTLSFRAAVELAIQNNLSLTAAEYGVRVTAEDSRQARSPLLPQLGLSIGARLIDKDRALPQNAQGQVNWSARFHQTLYDERSWGSFTSSKHALRAQQEAREGTKLNVVLDVATAYLDLLRSNTIVRIQKEDLSLSRENLDLARIRYRVGQAGKEEVFRWESRIAQSRRDLLTSTAQMAISRVKINTLLNRPAETPIVPEDLTLKTPGLLSSNASYRSYLANPTKFVVLADFTVQEGLGRAPELREYVAQMQGVQRTVTAEKRSYFLPTVGFDGSFNHRFVATDEDLLGLPDGVVIPGFDQDKFDWEIGISAQLPLFEGALKNASIGRGNAQHSQLSFQMQDTTRLIEETIRQALYRAAASYAAINITKDAERAAQGNLGIIKDKYQRGRSTIIELLDAQTQSIVAQDEAANAVFVFLADLLRVERASGRFDILLAPNEQNDFVQRLDQYRANRALNGGAENNGKSPASSTQQ